MNKPDKELNEHDLKSIRDWIKYYNNLYDKKGSQKYITKLAELVLKLQEKEKIVKENFQQAVMDNIASRIGQDMASMITGGNSFIEVSGTGKVKNIDGKDIIDEIDIESIQLVSKKLKKEKTDESKWNSNTDRPGMCTLY